MQKIWQKLTQPSPHITNKYRREQAVIISAGLLVITVPVALFLLFAFLTPLVEQQVRMIVLANVLIYSTLYLLSRTRYVVWSMRLSIWVGLSSVILIFMNTPEDVAISALYYFAIPIVLSGFLLSTTEATINVILAIVFVLFAEFFRPLVQFDTLGVVFMLLQVGFLAVVASHITRRYQRNAFDNEKRYRRLMEANNEGILVITAKDAKIIDTNPAIEQIIGYQSSELLNRNPFEFVAKEDKAYVWKLWQKRTQGITVEFSLEHKLGHKVIVEARLRSYPFQGQEAYVLTLLNITERHRAEAERRELENRYRTLFKTTTDAFFILQVDGTIRDANQRAVDLLNTTYDALIGSHVTNYIASEEHADSAQSIGRIRDGEVISTTNQRQMVRSDGSTFSAETIGIGITSEDSNDRYILSMVRDLTERIRSEEQRFQSALQHERTQFLAHFIENASHHFRTPITNMKTRMYILPRVFDKPEKRSEQIEVLNKELDRLQNILNDLLTVLRLQKDETEYSLVKIPLQQVIAEVRQTFEGRQIYQSYNWNWDVACGDCHVIVDRVRLAQALVQIVNNAANHTPRGGNIQVMLAPIDQWMTINIIDSGTGISPKDLPHIFDDFYRGQEAMERDNTSSGLGLTIAKLIIERFSGRIYATSGIEQGTHIQIILPNPERLSTHDMPTQMLALPNITDHHNTGAFSISS
ncbi:MAG: PAS domain S-box protein [Chloroflexota bacterium]